MSTRSPALAAARCIHTAIYVVMAFSTLALLYVGVSGRPMVSLWVFLPLIAIEIVAFAAGGLKCPLTAFIDHLAGDTEHVADTYLPERVTRHTLVIFGPILAAALMLLAARWVGMLGEGSRL